MYLVEQVEVLQWGVQQMEHCKGVEQSTGRLEGEHWRSNSVVEVVQRMGGIHLQLHKRVEQLVDRMEQQLVGQSHTLPHTRRTHHILHSTTQHYYITGLLTPLQCHTSNFPHDSTDMSYIDVYYS